MKLKYIIPIVAFIIIFYSCKKDDNPADNFDAVAQAIIDDELLIEYLQSHYYIPAGDNEPFGAIDTIQNGETPLLSQVETQNITHEEINYKLYYLLLNLGANDSPTRHDSVFVKYRGFLLDSIKFDENISFNTGKGWLNLTGVIQGWKYGFPNFKSGNNVTERNEPITFEDTGKGILFFPSGLAYSNIGTIGIGPNEPLLFHIELAQVVRADNDNDGVLNSDEDLNNDGEVSDDDTDGDTFPNYLDQDDDNDRVSTRDEDVDNDGDSTNDDTDNDGVPNYIDDDDDGDGTLTKDEDADGDGDPTNDDTDGDGIPDYLDADNS